MSMLSCDRYFSPEPSIRTLARELYEQIADLPLVCPHGHVDPRLFSDPTVSFNSPTELFITADHYIMRMLYSQGIPLESLGIPRTDGRKVERDHRKIWQTFCENFHLFRGTPSYVWITYELNEVFSINEKPSATNAYRLYEQISQKLCTPEFSPRALFKRFNIELLCTTDAATDTLGNHQAIQHSGWDGSIRPTFRPDAVINLDSKNWNSNICKLREVSDVDIVDYPTFIRALEQRREYFKSMGAMATDHAIMVPTTEQLSPAETNLIFERALCGKHTSQEATRFNAHMLMEMARMSIEDGLVMQLHPGAYRNHNRSLFLCFGPDVGADIPVQTEYTHNLLPLLNQYGNDNRLTLILFTLDETTFSRELATLAGHYPALKLGPPWWFYDSLNGIRRYFDQVIETAGIYNTAGFNDDTRAFCSIPARHDVWRRASADWVAGLLVRHIIDLNDAREMIRELAIGLAKRAYKIGS